MNVVYDLVRCHFEPSPLAIDHQTIFDNNSPMNRANVTIKRLNCPEWCRFQVNLWWNEPISIQYLHFWVIVQIVAIQESQAHLHKRIGIDIIDNNGYQIANQNHFVNYTPSNRALLSMTLFITNIYKQHAPNNIIIRYMTLEALITHVCVFDHNEMTWLPLCVT